jgi:hypothetical protein
VIRGKGLTVEVCGEQRLWMAGHLKLVELIQPAAETAIGPLWSRAEDEVAVSS